MTDAFNEVNDTDRLDLCDLAWYLKGLKAGGESPFTSQEQTLEKIIRCISRKVAEDNRKVSHSSCDAPPYTSPCR